MVVCSDVRLDKVMECQLVYTPVYLFVFCSRPEWDPRKAARVGSSTTTLQR